MRARWGVLLTTTTLIVSFAASVPQAQALAPQQLTVSADSGSDSNDCTSSAPCLTIQRALEVAGETPSVVSVVGGTYFGSWTVEAGQQITLLGINDGVVRPALEGPGQPGISNFGTLAISNFDLEAGAVIDQEAGTLSLTEVTSIVQALQVDGGTATVRSSSLGDSSQGEAIEFNDGSLTLSHTELGDPLVQTGGRLAADHLVAFDTPHALQLSGGSAAIEDSTFSQDFEPLEVDGDATVTADHVSFYESSGISVTGNAASLTLVAASISGSDSPLTAANDGVLRVAATVIDQGNDGRGPACSGPVVDGGWNSAFDETCGFSASSSVNSAPPIQLRSLETDGPDVPSLAPLAQPGLQYDGAASTVIDAIPAGSVSGFDSGITLCAVGSLDERGQSRPVDGACDIGAVELGPTTTKLTASTPATVYGKKLTLTARVRQSSGVPLKLNGGVHFSSPEQIPGRCYHVAVTPVGVATCTFRPVGINSTFTATYVPADALHSSTSTVKVRVSSAREQITLAVPSTRYGHTTVATGRITDSVTHRPLFRKAAQLYTRSNPNVPWQPIGRTHRSTANGTVSVTITPTHSAQYQLRSPGQTYLYLPGKSAVVDSGVARTFTSVHVTKKTVRRDATDTVYGTLAPARAGQHVYLQSRSAGRWTTTPFHARTRVQRLPNGRTTLSFTLPFKFSRTRSYTLRAYVMATRELRAGFSAPLSIRIT